MAALILLMLISLPMFAACPDSSGIVLSRLGNWSHNGRPLAEIDCVDPARLVGQGEIIILHGNGAKSKRSCNAAKECKTDSGLPPSPGRVARLGRLLSSMYGEPQGRPASSRSGGWNDAVLAIDLSRKPPPDIDVSEVFKGTPARRINNVRICPTDPAVECATRPRAVEWDGTAGRLPADDLAPGVFRIVEGNGTAEAWIRIVELNQVASIRTAHANAVRELDAIADADLPAMYASPAGRRALRRGALVTAGQE
jgi:hypothetical protein